MTRRLDPGASPSPTANLDNDTESQTMRVSTVATLIVTLLSADEGATAAEYAILTGLIAVVIVVAVAAFGLNVLALFASSTRRIIDATP